MLAVTNETVERLNQLAQQIRLDLGHLDPNWYVTVGGMRLHVGDEIVTRANDRTLRTDHGLMIRNRAAWTVTGITDDGLTVHGPDGIAFLPLCMCASQSSSATPNGPRRARSHR